MTIEFADSTFEGVQMVLDDLRYVRCVFRRCEIVYRGGVFNLDGCTFDGSTFRFEGAAAYTVEFLKAMSGIPGGHVYLDAIFPQRTRPPGTPLH